MENLNIRYDCMRVFYYRGVYIYIYMCDMCSYVIICVCAMCMCSMCSVCIGCVVCKNSMVVARSYSRSIL